MMDGVSMLDDIRFWSQAIEESRRTLICPPGLGDKVRAKLDELGVGGLNEVYESSACPADQILVMDQNAIEASTRQAIQGARP